MNAVTPLFVWCDIGHSFSVFAGQEYMPWSGACLLVRALVWPFGGCAGWGVLLLVGFVCAGQTRVVDDVSPMFGDVSRLPWRPGAV